MKTSKTIRVDGKILRPPGWGARTATLWTPNKTPTYSYTAPNWVGPLNKLKLVSPEHHLLVVPRHCDFLLLQGVYTILPRDSQGIVQCWTLTLSRGLSYKLVAGYYDHKSGIHAKTLRGLKRDIKRQRLARVSQWRMRKVEKLSAEELEAKLLSNKKVIYPYRVSRSVGNCAPGTREFLARLGLSDSRKGTVRAIYRLSRMKKLHKGPYFMLAARSTLIKTK